MGTIDFDKWVKINPKLTLILSFGLEFHVCIHFVKERYVTLLNIILFTTNAINIVRLQTDQLI